MVLRKREGLEGPVKSVPCLCDFALVHQTLAVVQPDTRHLGGRVWRGWRGGEREWGRCICRNTTCQHICKLTQLNDTYINMRAYVWEHNLACCHYSTAQQLRVAHLVHEDKCSLKGTVNTLVCWVDDAFSLDLCTTQLQVVVPQLVTTAGGGKEGEGGVCTYVHTASSPHNPCCSTSLLSVTIQTDILRKCSQ